MINKRRKAFYGFLVFAALATAIGAPSIIEGRRQMKAVDSVFNAYSHALTSGDYANAFQFCGEAFKESVSYEEFVRQQREVTSNLGRLETMDRKGIVVHGKGSHTKWIAVIETLQVYDRGNVHLVCEFHLENGNWKLFGCKRI
jgi:hypothetical protein